MKNLLTCLRPISSFLLLAFITISCGGKDSKPDTPSNPSSKQVNVTVSAETINVDAAAQTVDLNVKADADWGIRSNSSWVTLRPAGGVKNSATDVKVTIEANKEFDARTAVLDIFSGNNVVKSISVNQGYVMSATPSVSSLIMSGEEGKVTFTVTSNGNWSIDCGEDWISVSPKNGSKGETVVTVNATANEGDESREAALILN